MSIRQAMWIHGHSVVAENEKAFIDKAFQGNEAYFKAATRDEWFHFAIPTPVMFGGKFSLLEQIFILFRTVNESWVLKVDVWDGPNLIWQFNNLDVNGNFADSLTPKKNVWYAEPVHIRWGLGISVKVRFGVAYENTYPEIHFTSAGADFVIPE